MTSLEAMTWGPQPTLQIPSTTPRSESLLAAEPLPIEQQQLVAAAVVAAAPALAGAGVPAAAAAVKLWRAGCNMQHVISN
jgi:hypothetical protein